MEKEQPDQARDDSSAAPGGPPPAAGEPGAGAPEGAAEGLPKYTPTARDFELVEELRAFRPAKKQRPRKRR